MTQKNRQESNMLFKGGKLIHIDHELFFDISEYQGLMMGLFHETIPFTEFDSVYKQIAKRQWSDIYAFAPQILQILMQLDVEENQRRNLKRLGIQRILCHDGIKYTRIDEECFDQFWNVLQERFTVQVQ